MTGNESPRPAVQAAAPAAVARSSAPGRQAAAAVAGGTAPAPTVTRRAGPVGANALLAEAATKLQPSAPRQVTKSVLPPAASPGFNSGPAAAVGVARPDAQKSAVAQTAAATRPAPASAPPAAPPAASGAARVAAVAVSRPEGERQRSPRRSTPYIAEILIQQEVRHEDPLVAEVEAVLGTQADATFAGETRFLEFQVVHEVDDFKGAVGVRAYLLAFEGRPEDEWEWYTEEEMRCVGSRAS